MISINDVKNWYCTILAGKGWSWLICTRGCLCGKWSAGGTFTHTHTHTHTNWLICTRGCLCNFGSFVHVAVCVILASKGWSWLICTCGCLCGKWSARGTFTHTHTHTHSHSHTHNVQSYWITDKAISQNTPNTHICTHYTHTHTHKWQNNRHARHHPPTPHESCIKTRSPYHTQRYWYLQTCAASHKIKNSFSRMLPPHNITVLQNWALVTKEKLAPPLDSCASTLLQTWSGKSLEVKWVIITTPLPDSWPLLIKETTQRPP